MVFTPGVLATVSTCDMVISVPYCHDSYDKFKTFMVESLISNEGFKLL